MNRKGTRVDPPPAEAGEKSLAASAPTGVLVIMSEVAIAVDTDHKILVFNRSAENLLGYRASEALGRDLGMLLPSEPMSFHHSAPAPAI